jgi:iron complex outermembrane receptor protein
VLYVLCGIAVILVVITLLTSNGASLSTGKGSISGNVVNELGTPLPAEVYVVSTKLGTTANNDGNFVLENIPEGNREVIVTYSGQGVDLQVKITENQQLSLGVIQIRSTQIPTR